MSQAHKLVNKMSPILYWQIYLYKTELKNIFKAKVIAESEHIIKGI